MKTFFACVSCFSAQTGKSVSAGSNPDKAAAVSSRAAGFAGGTSRSGAGFVPAPDLRDAQAMFDSGCPYQSGDLLGFSFASTLENHHRYPSLRKKRDADLLAIIDCLVEYRIRCIAKLLPGLGFDRAGIVLYQAAALSAFRAALPIN
jgi:hypothetical protein